MLDVSDAARPPHQAKLRAYGRANTRRDAQTISDRLTSHASNGKRRDTHFDAIELDLGANTGITVHHHSAQ